MTAKKTTIKTMVFFKKWLNSFLAMSGRNLVDLKPDNLTNLHPFPDTFKPRIRVADLFFFLIGIAFCLVIFYDILYF